MNIFFLKGIGVSCSVRDTVLYDEPGPSVRCDMYIMWSCGSDTVLYTVVPERGSLVVALRPWSRQGDVLFVTSPSW